MNLRFPIGPFQKPETITSTIREGWIADIAAFPSQVAEAVRGLEVDQLHWCYRPMGWSILQVVHHCADSHMNASIRFKLALTEDTPTIRPYPEARFAELADSLDPDLGPVLQLIDALHTKWVALLQSLEEDQWDRPYYHPEDDATVPLHEAVGIYAWHCRHHLAHIHQALRAEGDMGMLETFAPVKEEPRVVGLGGVFFKCADPDAFKAWFTQHLGMPTDQWGTNMEGRSSLKPAQRTFLQWSAMKQDTDHFTPSSANFMLNYRVNDLEALAKKLKAAGVELLDEVATYDYGKFLHVAGPEGHKIELWEPVDARYDEYMGARTR
ncbi:MAG: YfiT family bacillithiol transferase [Flavobacteriales bacterium]